MKKRIISIICIVLLFFTITSPISVFCYSYATEEQEQLTTEEIIEAGIITYLNQRKAWIVNQTGNSIDTVQAVMQSYINAYDYWKQEPIGELTSLSANIIIRYSPFRVSLKGPAVRAFNDLYDWLVDSGKIPNAENSSGGETTDNLYNGAIYGNELFYSLNKTDPSSNNDVISSSNVSAGSFVDGWSTDYLKSYYVDHNTKNINITYDSSAGTLNQSDRKDGDFLPININYYNNVQQTKYIYYTNWKNYSPSYNTDIYTPYLMLSAIGSSSLNGFLASQIYNASGGAGNPCRYIYTNNGSQTSYYGWVYYNSVNSNYYFYKFGTVSRTDQPNITNASVNFFTDDFDKNDITPPENDDEITYTPEVKETSGNYTEGDTFNTYNEYITNYVTKNTTIVTNNNGGGNDPDPDPDEPSGGTTPPWTDNGSAGTLTPDGNGGFNLSLPDLTIPDLDIDWSINGLKEKFPFSIPWDLLAFFTVLNAEPETPAIEAQIDLGIVNWDIDWDLHNFDTLAVLLRNLEFIGFCLALILITRSIIKG